MNVERLGTNNKSFWPSASLDLTVFGLTRLSRELTRCASETSTPSTPLYCTRFPYVVPYFSWSLFSAVFFSYPRCNCRRTWRRSPSQREWSAELCCAVCPGILELWYISAPGAPSTNACLPDTATAVRSVKDGAKKLARHLIRC